MTLNRCIATFFLVILTSAVIYAAESESPFDTIEQMIEDGNYSRAKDLLRERLAANSKDVVALSMTGDIYRIEGNKNKALEFLDKAVAVDQSYPEPYFVMAKIYMSMQKFDEADARFGLFREKIRPLLTSDGSVKGYYLRALHYMATENLLMKRYDKFKELSDEILSLDPKDQTAYYNLGVYYYKFRHDRASAYKAFDTAVRINPSSSAGKRAEYAIEFIRANPDSRIAPAFSFIDQEFRN